MTATKIEWATDSWNPLTGCTKIAAGCKNCYAERMAKRLKAMGQRNYQDVIGEDGRWNGNIHLVREKLDEPLGWKKPRRVFVNSMSDLFHENVPNDYIEEILARCALASKHTFLILTKRPERMATYFKRINQNEAWPFPNVWIGTSVSTQEDADKNIPYLLDTPAAVRFVSVEPMLAPITLEDYLQYPPFTDGYKMRWDCKEFEGLDWVICGGESGPGARPMHPDWVRSLRDECVESETPFFFKQWGEWSQKLYFANGPKAHGSYVFPDGKLVVKLGKTAAGRELDGRTWDEYPRCSHE